MSRITRRGLERYWGEKVILTRDGRAIEGTVLKEDNLRERLFIQARKGTRKYSPKPGEDIQIPVKDGSGWIYRHYTFAGAA